MNRADVVQRAAAGIREVQRRSQATATEMREALSLLADTGADVLPRDIPPGDPESTCPRCDHQSRSAAVSGACAFCGYSWIEEDRKSPPPGGTR